MRGLHGCDDVELFESGDVVEVHNLGVFDAVPQALVALHLPHVRESVENRSVAPVADGMHAGLIPFGNHLADHLCEFIRIVK